MVVVVMFLYGGSGSGDIFCMVVVWCGVVWEWWLWWWILYDGVVVV